tara:strand:- start:807 stop:950 length:144 start_codon:yes stop_codon:yes gene_type:complete
VVLLTGGNTTTVDNTKKVPATRVWLRAARVLEEEEEEEEDDESSKSA